MKRLIYKEFANLINPESNNIIGNFASIDAKDAELNFAGNIVFKNGSILGIKANGGITDGLLSIFSNTEFNTKFGADVQYNFLFHKKKTIEYFRSEYLKYKKQEGKLKQEYKIKKIELEHENAKNELNIEIVKIQSEIKKKEKAITDIGKLIDTTTTLNKDSLALQTKKLQIDLEKQNSELAFNQDQLAKIPSKSQQETELNNWYNLKLDTIESNIKISGFKLGWFSIGYGISNNSFKLFDPSSPFDSQVSKHNFLSHSVELKYNYYIYTPVAYKTFFISVGAKYSFEDNLSSLTKVEISEAESYGPNNERKITDKYNAYKGAYKDSLHTVSFNADFYYFLFKDNKAAIHIYPEEKIATGIEPITNLGFGFLFTFKNKTESGNIVNIEPYANLFDLANNRHSEESLVKRSDYGLRVTFPFNFKTNVKSK
ncbi:MAG: hypothetical protein A2X13_15070 [Bacteroidetes bacterium GWC2_33_15]|nr:MAG: hypothetical protein A2X10_07135 [Bacteroidetes bacterium GWA2_33_15]OFX50191.1 MAG: hypothetical protein A2X13_15070 [Bacteroidetes bacterium GWC2_33_15]OFX65343.1 MAG: hypothetical protein A2X15_04645 [Bacteroidetes bacterium GWB2_32_14]OFX70570.1 MAG: hypothetical protein A2X14_04700 [Bacteroidetes bacterium GWD2_33_33]HAN19556.1 hypothetical protein [Bacteroidales bacterium]